jgi:hypothetical protein
VFAKSAAPPLSPSAQGVIVGHRTLRKADDTMSVQLQDRFNDPLTTAGFPPYDEDLDAPPASIGAAPPNGDMVSRLLNPGALFGGLSTPSLGSSGCSGLSSIISQLVAIIQQLLSGTGWNGGSTSQQYFSSATGGSNGDPHLSFNGSTWNDMNGAWNLIDSDSFPGGFRISTQTTAPNAAGVTYNRQATLTTNFGTTAVTLSNDGAATYLQNGTTNAIAPGQTIDLGNGETVARNSNGSLTIACTTPSGGTITTTMCDKGQGVDVNVDANNVDLGGTLVNGSNATTPQPEPLPVYRRYAAPSP